MPSPRLLIPLLAAAILTGCGTGKLTGKTPGEPVYARETFEADESHSRLYDGTVAATCEAGRRALLSQGYVISAADNRLVRGTKRFQPEGEVHVEINFNIVCAAEGDKTATMFVSAQQDKYVVKKNPTAASIGVSAIGSVSVPLGSTEDSLVKVASETIPSGVFYERFFSLVDKMLKQQPDGG